MITLQYLRVEGGQGAWFLSKCMLRVIVIGRVVDCGGGHEKDPRKRIQYNALKNSVREAGRWGVVRVCPNAWNCKSVACAKGAYTYINQSINR